MSNKSTIIVIGVIIGICGLVGITYISNSSESSGSSLPSLSSLSSVSSASESPTLNQQHLFSDPISIPDNGVPYSPNKPVSNYNTAHWGGKYKTKHRKNKSIKNKTKKNKSIKNKTK